MRRQLRRLGDHGDINIYQQVTRSDEASLHLGQQLKRIGVLPAVVRVGKEAPDISHGGGAEQSIDDSMRHRIAIRVPGQPGDVLDDDPGEFQWPLGAESVGIVSDTKALPHYWFSLALRQPSSRKPRSLGTAPRNLPSNEMKTLAGRLPLTGTLA